MGEPAEDPGLPIKFGPCSNGEFVPPPLTRVEREAIRRAHLACGENARGLGMSRRQFLFTASAAATTLLALQGCLDDSGNTSGGSYTVPAGAGRDQDAAREALAGEEFIFDVQGHHLEYDLMPSSRGEPFFGAVFPQVSCGLDDPRACFAREVFLEEFFLRSDTNMVTLSALPIAPQGSPLSAAIMEETRHTAELVCGWDSVLLHAQALPNYGPLEANLDEMEANARRYPIAAWKVFTHFPDAFGDPGNAWRLDDADPSLPQVGHAFIDKARQLGVKTICAHKGFGAGSGHASPEDVPRAALRLPRRGLHRLPLGVRGHGPAGGPVHGRDRESRGQSPDHGDEAAWGGPEPERLRRARLDLVDDHARPDAGRPCARQAAPLRR